MEKLIILCFAITVSAYSQTKIKDGATSSLPNANAVLEVESTSRGLLVPRVALSATNNFSPLTAHVAGMTVYNTATTGTYPNDVAPGFYCNDGNKWVKMATGDFEFEDLDAGPVLEYPVNTPPASPADGDAYIIGTSPTGAWAGQSNKVATWNATGGTWSIVAAITNAHHFILQGTNSGKTYKWNGSAWVQITIPKSTDWTMAGNNNAKATSALGALNNQPLRIFSGQKEHIRVATNGNVGIGTTAPTTTLDINNSSSTISALRVRTLSNTTSKSASAINYDKDIGPLYADTNGHVFIRTFPKATNVNSLEFDGAKFCTTSDSTLVVLGTGSIIKFELQTTFTFGASTSSLMYADISWSELTGFKVPYYGADNGAGSNTFTLTGVGTNILTFDFNTGVDLILEMKNVSGTNKIVYRSSSGTPYFVVYNSIRSRTN